MTENAAPDIRRYAQERRRRDTVRKAVLLVLLVALLALFTWSAWYYAANRRLPFPQLENIRSQQVEPPTFLYAITGPEGADALAQPIGVAVDGQGRVFVVDVKARVVRSYTIDGDYRFSFSAVKSDRGDALKLPARVAIGPDGNVWVTDRRLRGVFVFDPDDGSFIREFVPKSDITETWGPLALAFDAKGDLYVADVGLSSQHRIVAFDPEGNEIARWGTTVEVVKMTDSPGGFNYPNGIAFAKNGDVFVSDMNNHRIQVFSPTGEFKYLIPSSGSPLGLAIDPEQRLYAVDPFAHTIDVYSLKGERITGFGEPGLGLGQFRFPSDIALDEEGRILVSDRENNQVQVWGWPTGALPPVVLPEKPAEWAICLSPLLLLLLPLLRRRTTFMTTSDFIEAMIAAEQVSLMDDRRFRWAVTETVYREWEDRSADGVAFADLLDEQPYSRPDVEDLVERTGVDEATAIVLTMAERIGRLATEDSALAEAARALDIEIVDRERFVRVYATRRGRQTVRQDG